MTVNVIRGLVLSWIMVVGVAIAEINVISDFTLLDQTIKQCDHSTLVIFDVDHVLIMPTDEYTLNRHPYRKELWEELQSRISKEEWKILYGATASKIKWRLVDQDILNIFAYLKENKIPSIALTSIYTGNFGVIEKIEDWREKHLKELGLDFSVVSPLKHDVYATELEELGGIPMLKAGVILTANVDKAKVLEYILQKTNYKPQKIIFIDDILTNIESVGTLASKINVEFVGFHYIAVSKMPRPTIDEHIEKLRFQILEKEGKWLNYQEISERE